MSFYDKQLRKIQKFYQELIQSLEVEKTSTLNSFFGHKQRAEEVYCRFQDEIEKDEKDLKFMESSLLKVEDKNNLQNLITRTQEKIFTAKLNLNSINQEFFSVFRTTGLNEDRLCSLKSNFFPLFEIVQIPTSLLKKNLKFEKKKMKKESDMNFEKNIKNENSMKFKNILEKIKKNQARNSELYMQAGKKENENDGNNIKVLQRAKSFPSFHQNSKEYKIDEPFMSFIEKKLNESQELTTLFEHPPYQKTLFCSPSFKEI